MSGGRTGARLLVQNLEAQGIEYIFGIPGAKIDPVFDALLDSKIKTVVCRHEQNAAFIAGGDDGIFEALIFATVLLIVGFGFKVGPIWVSFL